MPPILIIQGFFADIDVPTPARTLDEHDCQLEADCYASFERDNPNERQKLKDFYARMGLTPPKGE